MTREEQIEDAADAFSRAKIVAGNINFIKEECFRQGAEWADENRWVKVEDGLPEKVKNHRTSKKVCVTDGKHWDHAYYEHRSQYWTCWFQPTHWCDMDYFLPSPPKAEQ